MICLIKDQQKQWLEVWMKLPCSWHSKEKKCWLWCPEISSTAQFWRKDFCSIITEGFGCHEKVVIHKINWRCAGQGKVWKQGFQLDAVAGNQVRNAWLRRWWKVFKFRIHIASRANRFYWPIMNGRGWSQKTPVFVLSHQENRDHFLR